MQKKKIVQKNIQVFDFFFCKNQLFKFRTFSEHVQYVFEQVESWIRVRQLSRLIELCFRVCVCWCTTFRFWIDLNCVVTWNRKLVAKPVWCYGLHSMQSVLELNSQFLNSKSSFQITFKRFSRPFESGDNLDLVLSLSLYRIQYGASLTNFHSIKVFA